jgi:hypothetical protein
MSILHRAFQTFRFAGLIVTKGAKFTLSAVLVVAALMVVGNLAFHSQRGIPYRALAPDASACQDGIQNGWDILSRRERGQVPNDEFSAMELGGENWRTRFACVIQRHIIPNYKSPDGSVRQLAYNLAFIEFREDGKPFALRELCGVAETDCADEGYGPVKRTNKTQLDAVLANLNATGPHYVMVFVHGWRNDASIGNANVAEFRQYAAHAARFIEDRAARNPEASKPQVTAIFIGWRGARTDETSLRRRFGIVGAWIGTFSAVLTLFDRKPVSEAIAPSVLQGLRAIETKLGLVRERQDEDSEDNANKMIVFGHSLGGDLLISALGEDLVKKIHQHNPEQNMYPVLGDLVVLINPAAEAAKWIHIQRAVWQRIAMNPSERRTAVEHIGAQMFFPPDQAPIVVAVTAARDWPPGDDEKPIASREVSKPWATRKGIVRS